MPPPETPSRAALDTRRPRLRALLARALAAALATAALAVVPAGAPPSEATSTYLCTGYTACANAGYSHAGYGSRNQTMYWRMYAGHNCTNYVAYRMIQKGMSTERPWSGSGMAYNWGFAMSGITDDKPAVGAVAWWNRGVAGAGSSGHVAYIEKVVSPTEIVISEDSWSGDFHWRTIYKNGPGWPTGFIHFVDTEVKAITASKAPVVTGTPQVGVALTGALAGFTPAVSAHTVQWLANGVAIPGATRMTYVPTADTVGKTITMRDTGTRSGYVAAAATSTASTPVVAGALVRVAKPAIAGVPEVDGVLSAVPGQWSPMPESSVFKWRADGVNLGTSLDGPTLTLTQDLEGKAISVVEVARRRGYTNLANASDRVGPVVAGVIELTTPFVASGAATTGSTLAFAPGTWTPADATATYQWFRDGAVVAGQTASSYRLGAADIGRRVTVTATVARERYQSVTQSADYGVVTTPSTLIVRPSGRKRAAVAKVRVWAAGVAAPTGTIWARIGKKVVRGTVVDGRAELRLEGLAKGTKTMLVLYAGNGVVQESRAYARVTVKPA